ncbi:hypothetical protein CYMTET_3672 [Cymbomonas tetramitiformis]|uniref:Uncharacterized protein n=1 Tax=Cymbomonas tetramitiformis TaxID=36881 RepID=A0AAE0H2R2_9CHLO|nr:hypothetical protein CYMTET_3672 [Cymbomonas tetramitiformis]|eukprot:gene1508-2141_t
MATAAPGAYVGTGSDVGTGRAHGTDNRQIASGDGPNAGRFEPYFGENPKPYMLSPYDSFGRENFALPEAYLGYSPYMTNVMINLIKTEDMWPTVVMPYRETKDTSAIKWDEIHFNRHFLGPVPEEGVSRLVSQEMSERRDHYTRYGLAMILEHGFMNTDKGRMCYVNNLQQIRNAVLETVYLGVLEAYLRCKKYDDMWNERFGGVRSAAASRKSLMMEIEDWATIQKTEHGWDLLDSRCKRYLRSKNVTPDTWIIPEGLKPYISQVRRENYTYMLAGPEGPQNFKSGLNGQPANVVDARNDCKIYESKSFELPDMNEPVDVMRRNRAIGEFYIMREDTESAQQCGKYLSSHRNIVIYDEDVDNFTEIRLADAFSNDPLLSNNNYLQDGYGNVRRKRIYPAGDANTSGCDSLMRFGDIPPEEDNAENRGPPMSDSTLNLFAETFFDEEDKRGFVADLGRSVPQYLIQMNGKECDICTDSFAENAKQLFEAVASVQSAFEWKHVKDSKDNITKITRQLFSKNNDTYAFWLLCHGVASQPADGTDRCTEIDDSLRSMYMRQISSRGGEGDPIPLPPQMSVQCFQQTVCAVFLTFVRLTTTTAGFVKQFEGLDNAVERVSGDLCGLWFDSCTDATSKGAYVSPTLDLYNGIMLNRMLVPSDTASATFTYGTSRDNLPNRTFQAAMFVTRVLFQYLSTSQVIKRGEACDCVPVGYNTYRGIQQLAAVDNNRSYESDKCSKMIQSHAHMRGGLTSIFSSEHLGIFKTEEDLFNICVARHAVPGNIQIGVKDIHSTTADGWSLGFVRMDANLLDKIVQCVETSRPDTPVYAVSYQMEAELESMACTGSSAGSGCLFGRLLEYLDTYSAQLLDVTQDTPEIEIVRAVLREIDVYAAEMCSNFIESSPPDIQVDLSRAIHAYLQLRDRQEGCRTVKRLAEIGQHSACIFWARLQLALAFESAYCCVQNLVVHAEQASRSADIKRMVPLNLDEIDLLQSIRTTFDQYTCTIYKTEDPNKYRLSLLHGMITFKVDIDPAQFAQMEDVSTYCLYPDEVISTVFKAPESFRNTNVFSRKSCGRDSSTSLPDFLHYLDEYRRRSGSTTQSCDQVYDDYCDRLNGDHSAPAETRTSRGDLGGDGRETVAMSRDDHQSPIVTTERCLDRMRSVLDGKLRSKPHALMVYILFCMQEVNSDFLKKLIEGDVMFPFGYLLLRPYQTYEMCTAVLTKSGAETGETLIGHYDFQLSDNVVQKMHYGNFTIYEKSVVYRPMNVHLAEDIFCANYVGGAGSEFRKADTEFGATEDLDAYYNKMPSLYACAIGFEEQVKDNPISVTGGFEPHTCLTSMKARHYSTCHVYSHFYGFHPQTAPNGDMPYFDSASRGNTMCFQGHQASYNHNSGYIDRVTLNTGHWGERVYPGCGKVRRGLSKYLEPVNYATMRKGGGGASSSGFSVMT